MEYVALRAEILQRINLRQQIISVTLTLAGIFLGLGLTNEAVALIYPPLAAFLAFGWAQNDFRIRDAAQYIREHLETRMPGLRFETMVQLERAKSTGLGSWRFVVLSHGGIFLGTQLIAICIELFKLTFSPLEGVLIVLDWAAVAAVYWLLRQSGRGAKGIERAAALAGAKAE